MGGLIIDDSSGNENGTIDPGETVILASPSSTKAIAPAQ